MATVNLGRVKPLWRGQFNYDTQYEPLDYLKYNGGLYFCVATPQKGTLPTNATYFEPVINPADISNIEYWDTLSGELLRPAMTYHNGDYWMLTTDLTNVAEAEPGISESWTRISQDDLGILTPSIISPADGTEGFYGIIESSAYQTGPRFSGTHNKSIFQASTVPDFATIYAEEEITAGNLTQWEMPLPDPLTRVWVRVMYESMENASYFSAPVEVVTANYSAPAPTFIDPVNSETGWMPGSTIQISAYSPNLPDDHIATNWQILNAGGTVIWQSLEDANNLTSITPPNNIFNPEAAHTLRAAHIGQFFGEQGYGEISVTTIAAPTPTNQSPTNGAINIWPYEALTASAMPAEFTHIASQWRVIRVSDSMIIHDSGETTASLTRYTVPSDVVESTTYEWQVRYKTSKYGMGPWSVATAFTTDSSFVIDFEADIGRPYGGGYVAGKIVSDYDGLTYGIVVSDGSGDTMEMGVGRLKWRSPRAAISSTQGVPPMTLADGRANHNAILSLNDLASYPAFKWIEDNCNAATGLNGYTDWYLPSRDELEVIYRNFKPTTQDNNTNTRPTSGFGGDGAVYGTNANSVPTGSGYMPSSPAQTTHSSFQEGGADAFSGTTYWSSTESDSDSTFHPSFRDGAQGAFFKDYAHSVRAVRRVAL